MGGFCSCHHDAVRLRRKPELTRSELVEREAAFDAALDELLISLRGASERTARSAVANLFRTHGKTLSEPQLSLFAREGMDPNWAEGQPERLAALMRALEDEAARIGNPWENQ